MHDGTKKVRVRFTRFKAKTAEQRKTYVTNPSSKCWVVFEGLGHFGAAVDLLVLDKLVETLLPRTITTISRFEKANLVEKVHSVLTKTAVAMKVSLVGTPVAQDGKLTRDVEISMLSLVLFETFVVLHPAWIVRRLSCFAARRVGRCRRRGRLGGCCRGIRGATGLLRLGSSSIRHWETLTFDRHDGQFVPPLTHKGLSLFGLFE